MNKRLQEWALSFPCTRCAYLGVQKLGTVHVLGKDDKGDLQIIAFCYDCARIMMTNRRPRPDRLGPTPMASDGRTGPIKLVPRKTSAPNDAAITQNATASNGLEAQRQVGQLRIEVAQLLEVISSLKSSSASWKEVGVAETSAPRSRRAPEAKS